MTDLVTPRGLKTFSRLIFGFSFSVSTTGQDEAWKTDQEETV